MNKALMREALAKFEERILEIKQVEYMRFHHADRKWPDPKPMQAQLDEMREAIIGMVEDGPATPQADVTTLFTEWERIHLLRYSAGNALTYMGHHDHGGLKPHEIEEMERWKTLADKLKKPEPETQETADESRQ